MENEQATPPEDSNPLEYPALNRECIERFNKMYEENPVVTFFYPWQKPNDRYLKTAMMSKKYQKTGKQCEFLHNGSVGQHHSTNPIPEKTCREQHICPYCETQFFFLAY